MENKKISYGKEKDLSLKTLIALSRCYQDVHKKETKTIKEAGVTVSQFAVLELLYHKGDMRVCEITEKVLSTAGNMTVIIENLVKDDLVTRTIDPNDRRVNLISLTEKGRKIIVENFPVHVNNINEIFSVLSTDEKENLLKLLKKLSGV
jgi:DNA-binding MarR family transcriptional regulator